MKSWRKLLAATLVVFLVAISLAIASAGCAPAANTGSTTAGSPYHLTHTASDAEHILSWETVVSRCPDLGSDRIEAFVHRGQTAEIGPGESVSLDTSSPAAWADTRIVRVPTQDQGFARSFIVEIMYFDTSDYLDEYVQSLQSSGLIFQQDGDFVTSVVEGGSQTQSLQLLLAGKQFAVSVSELAATGQSPFCTQRNLKDLFQAAMATISSVEITSLPPGYPLRTS